jgi:hypothetical protein
MCVREADAHRAPRDILAKNMRLRAKSALTQALAFKCGINRTYLSAVERAERNRGNAAEGL